ncbi:MAG: endonuclease/exonuclease/phosphatase family protein [Kiritimatiellae bacterium]|nr:endonuclease/exonuclease/phosphatase family protein [Kiritimatiellia bacterium]
MTFRKIASAALCAVVAAGCSTEVSARGGRKPDMKLMSFNVLHCAGFDNKIDIARTAEVIRREAPRFVGVQELDCKAAGRSGGVDQPAELGRLAGMHATFAQAIPYQGGGYGVAVLSREKPLSVFKTPLPGEEPRVLLLCEFKDCWFGTTHLSLQETNRLAAVEIIRKAVEERAGEKPVYLTGDWNATPDSKVLDAVRSFMTILSTTSSRTFHGFNPKARPDRPCIDYVAVDSGAARRLVVRESHVVPDVKTSDHSPIVASVAEAGRPFAICSFNMRTDCDKGEFAWTNRLPHILKVIENHRFDVIGAQELKLNQVAHLREALGPKGYEIVGRGRLAEGKSEGVYIIYNSRRFECVASDTFQLSETPDVWGSSSWDSAYPRTCVWTLLRERESGVEFRFYNTHLDHVSELARRKGMELVVGRVDADVSSGMTAFLTGDLNCELKPGNAIEYVRKSMLDTADLSLTPHRGPVNTFHGYHPPARSLIDYVFAKGPVRVLCHATLDDMPDGKVPSDHFPVAAYVALPARPCGAERQSR